MTRSAAAAGRGRPLIDRPRLIEQLGHRFRHRLMFVSAPGGGGKSTLIRQAAAAELENVDINYSCRPVDRSPDRLIAHLAAAAMADLEHGGAGNETPTVDGLIDLVLAQSPRQVCLVVDDTHHLGDFEVFSDLLRGLPTNGHLLLAGRRRPLLETARLDAAGEFSELSQADLLMTEQEQIDFANLRGIDRGLLDGAEGWPAFVELAASGSQVRSRRYLEEEALRDLAPDRRRALAQFAFVGGGTDEICRTVTGRTLADLLEQLPLVRWIDGRAGLHDLWAEVLVDELTVEERQEAALAATVELRRDGQYDRAIDLGTEVGAWADVAASIGAAVRDGVDGGLRLDQLRRWRGALPKEADETPIALLIDGLMEREADPTSDRTWALLERAADGFEAAPESRDLELVALLQLGYVGRISGDPQRLAPIIARVEKLAEAYPPARPYLFFGQAWTALAEGRPDRQLTAMQQLRNDDLPPLWRVTRDHLLAHALYNLGRPSEALDCVPQLVETLPIPIPGALVTESQCLWMAGRPDQALLRRPSGMNDRFGARDRFIAGAWNGLMLAMTGATAAARDALDVARASHGEQPSLLVAAQLIAVELVIKLAEGHDDEVAVELEAILEQVPLGGGVSEQMLRNHLAIPYVLLPATRPYWDETDLGPSLRKVRTLASTFVAAREGDLGPMATLAWPDPGLIAAQLPVPWAIEFALRGMVAGCHQGRRLARWLCEKWGEPARTALRERLDDKVLGPSAREILASTPSPPSHRTTVRLLGHTDVLIDGYPADSPDLRRERCRALLALLVLKREATRDELAGALWPDHSEERAAKNLRTTLGYVHGLLEPTRAAGDAPWFIRVEGQHVRVDDSLDVDLWRFRELLDEADAAEKGGHANAALPLLLEGVALWRADLAADLDLECLELERIHLRSRFVRASCRAAELLVAVGRPTEAVDVARLSLTIDRWSERGYLALADAYSALGDRTAAAAVLSQGEATIGVPLARR